MAGAEPDAHLIDYYSRRFDESARLELPDGWLELRRTQELLRERLPAPPALILDVGGGAGAHAAWLARDGHRVVLYDVVPGHVRAAIARGIDAHLADARALPAPDGAADACLLLGPLYHLPEAADRARALAEAVRVTRPGGIVVAAAISRFAQLFDELRNGTLTAERAERMTPMLESGRHRPEATFTHAYLHRPAELAAEMTAAGLDDVELRGVEGPAWMLFVPDIAPERAEVLLEPALRAARLCDRDADMLSASPHLLAFARTT